MTHNTVLSDDVTLADGTNTRGVLVWVDEDNNPVQSFTAIQGIPMLCLYGGEKIAMGEDITVAGVKYTVSKAPYHDYSGATLKVVLSGPIVESE